MLKAAQPSFVVVQRLAHAHENLKFGLPRGCTISLKGFGFKALGLGYEQGLKDYSRNKLCTMPYLCVGNLNTVRETW